MKVLVTGATGFVGRALCEALSRDGHELLVLTRDSTKTRSLIPAPHQALSWDFSSLKIQDPSFLEKIGEKNDAVIHLSGEPILAKRWNSQVEKKLYDSRVKSTENLIALLKAHCKVFPKIFISASAVGFYGDRGDEVLEETSQAGSDFLSKICQDWERVFDSSLSETRKVALRIGIVLGRGGGALEQIVDLFTTGLGGRLGSGTQWMSWIHLDDLVRVMIECLTNKQLSGPINCCSPSPITNREFTKVLADTLKIAAVIPAPKAALRLALGKGASVLLSSQRVYPKKLTSIGYSFKYSTLQAALSQILGESYSHGYSEFRQKCWIPLPVEEVFDFFSAAVNLEKITPPWLHFHILTQSTERVSLGTTIDYRLKIHGLPARWKTEIASWSPPHDFTDTQLQGPYQVWKHTHRFSKLGNGTLMEDQVVYQLPLGILGKLVAGKFVKKDVSKIFTYRNQRIYDLLLRKP